MHLQDKLDKTYGRNRQKTSIGIYNFDLIKPPIEYTAVNPNEVRFVPIRIYRKNGFRRNFGATSKRRRIWANSEEKSAVPNAV